MTKDFADRSTRKRPPAKRPATKRATSSRSRARTQASRTSAAAGPKLLHTPSFFAGAIIGAAVVLVVAYAPELTNLTSAEPAQAAAAATKPDTPPAVRFEFPELLRQSNVTADPNSYAVEEKKPEDADRNFSIQAASFRDQRDANTMRAELLLINLPCEVMVSEGVNGRWHRVIVGPFTRRIEAQRAMTKLREQNISAIMLN